MKNIIFVFCMIVSSNSFSQTKVSKVIGGYETNPNPVSAYTIWGSKICTATKIADRVLLTAAHCLVNESTSKFYAMLDNYVFVPTQFIIHPEYAGEPKNDIGLIIFNQDLRGDVIPILPDSSNLIYKEVEGVGYGVDTYPDKGFGVPRYAKMVVGAVSDKLVYLNNIGEGVTCYGDSGSSFTFNGHIVGITTQGNCEGVSLLTRVDVKLKWIEENIGYSLKDNSKEIIYGCSSSGNYSTNLLVIVLILVVLWLQGKVRR